MFHAKNVLSLNVIGLVKTRVFLLKGLATKNLFMVVEDGCVATETSEAARWSQKGAKVSK